MNVLGEVVDPDGRRVVLDQEGWDLIRDGHAVDGGHRRATIATVTSPDHRAANPTFPERERPYREPGRAVPAYLLRDEPP